MRRPLDTVDRLKRTLLGRQVRGLLSLSGRTVVTLCCESSTGGRASFETVDKWMSADGPMVQKMESPRYTGFTLSAKGAGAVVVRPASGVPHRIAGWLPAHLVDVGAGTHEQPAKTPPDFATLRDRLAPLTGGWSP